MSTRLWKINCMEDRYPGMWQRWFKHQCVGVGWASKWGYRLRGATEGGHGWSRARRLLEEIQPGDRIVVSLRGHRVGRIGEVTGKAIEDADWDPLVPPSRDLPDGEMGRRIRVRWDLTTGPDDRELVVSLPEAARFTQGELRPTVAEIRSQTLSRLRRTMNDPANWTGLLSQFYYERSLSDYVSAYPDAIRPPPPAQSKEQRNIENILFAATFGELTLLTSGGDQPTFDRAGELYKKRFRRRLALDPHPTALGLAHGVDLARNADELAVILILLEEHGVDGDGARVGEFHGLAVGRKPGFVVSGRSGGLLVLLGALLTIWAAAAGGQQERKEEQSP